MAELRIQRKAGTNWMWWIVGLVVLAVALWWLMSTRGNTNTAATTPPGTVASAAAASGTYASADSSRSANAPSTITDLSALAAARSAGDLVGTPVQLSAVPVDAVVSDKGFWVGASGADQRIFVVRGNQDSSFTAPNGAVDAGKHVNIFGVVRATPADLTQQSTEWNLKATDSLAIAHHPIYVHADSVRLAP